MKSTPQRSNENRIKLPENFTRGDAAQVSKYEFVTDRGVYNMSSAIWNIRNGIATAGKFVTAAAADAPAAIPVERPVVAINQQAAYIDYLASEAVGATEQDADAQERHRLALELVEQAHGGNNPELEHA